MKKIVITLLVVLIAALLPLTIAFAQTVPPTPPDLVTLLNVAIQIFTTLVGWPAALAALINILMKFNLVTAASAAWVSFVGNALVFLGVAYLVFTGQGALATTIDTSFGGLAQILINILVVLGGFGLAFMQTGKITQGIAEHAAHFSAARTAYFTKG